MSNEIDRWLHWRPKIAAGPEASVEVSRKKPQEAESCPEGIDGVWTAQEHERLSIIPGAGPRGEVKDAIEPFKKMLGARLREVIPARQRNRCCSTFDQWQRPQVLRLFEEARRSPPDRAREKAAEKQHRQEWLAHQRRMARGWAKWMSWWQEEPQNANQYRARHEDPAGEWLLMMAERQVPPAKRCH